MKLKESVQALRCRDRSEKPPNEGCKKCPYWATENLEEWQKLCGWASCKVYQIISDAADAIERLTAENADLGKEIEWKDMVIALAQREQAKAEAERDALIILPCKVGDAVWFVRSAYRQVDSPIEATVTGFASYGTTGELIYTTMTVEGQITRRFLEHQIGKTAFLSLEEAERALEELKNV